MSRSRYQWALRKVFVRCDCWNVEIKVHSQNYGCRECVVFFFFLLLNPFHVLVLIIFLFVKMVGCQKLGFSPRLLPSCTCLCSGLLFCHHCWWKSLWCDSGRSTHRWGHLVTFSHIFRLSCSPSDRSELLLIISLNGLFSSWTVGGALSSHYC